MLIVLGLYAASSNYPCLWCEISSDELHITGNKRSFKNAIQVVKEHMGYKYEALIEDIPHEMFILELLHMFLRITDLLLNLLVNDLIILDGFHATTKFDPAKHKNLEILNKCFLNKCKFNFNYF